MWQVWNTLLPSGIKLGNKIRRCLENPKYLKLNNLFLNKSQNKLRLKKEKGN